MSMPVREMDSYESSVSPKLQQSKKFSEQENDSSTSKTTTVDSAREDTVKISREARERTKEFERSEEGKSSNVKEQTVNSRKLETNRLEISLEEERRSEEQEKHEQQSRDSEKRTEDVQREQRGVEEEDWDRVDDKRIERKIAQEEYDKRIIHEMESQDRAPEVEQNTPERKADFPEHEEKQKPENKAATEEASVIEQREQLKFKEEGWDRIEDERIEDREVQNENEVRSAREMESPDRVPESEQLEPEREEAPSERNEEIIVEQETKIEEENAIRDEEADAAKAFTASYSNNPSSPGNIINVTA